MDIHVERDDKVATFWLDPIRLQNSGGFSRFELSEIRGIIEKQQKSFREALDEYVNG
ncbi:MAG: DUF4160 domain-containing protein [Chlorobi bacterium]|nr:DUF4160 domain-containing protein [Chlorobiota bacterium]